MSADKVESGSLPNIDKSVVTDFGKEWSRYDQSELDIQEQQRFFDAYFGIFPWGRLPVAAVGMDVGCGSGRWAKLVAPRVGTLHCVDASSAALDVAQRNLVGLPNCKFHVATTDELPVADASLDFAYSLGVLHHIPDTRRAIFDCIRKVKPGGPFLLYLYYALDDRPFWFRWLWAASDLVRRVVSNMPFRAKVLVSTAIAASVYLPFARLARMLEGLGLDVRGLPLSAYRAASFYTMRTDALDRFGTKLEQRFSREQIAHMMLEAGLEEVRFSDQAPFWCAVGFRST